MIDTRCNNFGVLCDYTDGVVALVKQFLEDYFDVSLSTDEVLDAFVGTEFMGDVFEFNDYYFDVTDVYYCLKHNIDRATLFDWYDYNLQWGAYKHTINLRSWAMGCPRRTTSDLDRVRKAEELKNEAEKEFNKLLEQFKNE